MGLVPYCLQLKAEALKRREEAKMQAAKAKVQKAKAEDKQKEDLRVKRSPTPYILFLTERVKAISHLPVSERFKASVTNVNVWSSAPCCLHILLFILAWCCMLSS